jgi:hypothetical protein
MTHYLCVMVSLIVSLVVNRVLDRQSRQNKDFKMVFSDSLLTSQSSRLRANIHFCDSVLSVRVVCYCLFISILSLEFQLNQGL